MFNRTHRMTVSLSFIALFFIDDPSLASATLVSKDRPTLLEFASDAHCFRRPNHVGHRFDCYDPTNNWFISAFGHLFMEKQQRVWAIWGIGNLIVVSGIGQVMKWLIQRPRPVLEAGMVRDSHSFPSGHTLLAVTLVTTCLLFTRFLFKKKVCWLSSAALSFLVIFSRFYLGVHYPSDTLASICLASGITLMTYEWTERILTSKSNNLSDKFKQRRRP